MNWRTKDKIENSCIPLEQLERRLAKVGTKQQPPPKVWYALDQLAIVMDLSEEELSQWMLDAGLRDADAETSRFAHMEGYVRRHRKEKGIYLWHSHKVMELYRTNASYCVY